jgi:hypothetical protein
MLPGFSPHHCLDNDEKMYIYDPLSTGGLIGAIISSQGRLE